MKETKLKFKSLGSKVREFLGLETFPTPKGVKQVTCVSDEVTAVCPVTGQPDWYTVEIVYFPKKKCVESKSLKLYLQSFRNKGLFCETFSRVIASDLKKALKPSKVRVTVCQEARGGIAIFSTTELQ